MNPWTFYLISAGIVIGLALPPAIAQRSIGRLIRGLIITFAGVTLPLFFFGTSSFLVPEWKGACHLGWIDCFILGKLALSPLVLWATAALYAVDVSDARDKNRWWIGMGFFMGAMVSFGCLIFLLLTAMHEFRDAQAAAWIFLVPLYTCVWHTARAVQAFRARTLNVPDLIKGIFGSTPFWMGSVIWSRSVYAGLPDVPPNCFVVGAATLAHPRLTGRKRLMIRRGQLLWVTRQLATFWCFEHEWTTHYPKSHAAFRSIYNHIGPAIASQVRFVWIADLVYLLLLPAEFALACILTLASKSHDYGNNL